MTSGSLPNKPATSNQLVSSRVLPVIPVIFVTELDTLQMTVDSKVTSVTTAARWAKYGLPVTKLSVKNLLLLLNRSKVLNTCHSVMIMLIVTTMSP